ncbi:hypothetical protein [Bradyrhizobium sp. CB2312]|uniref:hypothetical protein n=1 Tax=Bradyrhizobium sp. CB2312 TaxID=3039155 RepID=UPI0024B16F51|nr:hypothetical protein [Bradyrhizobium sp. CB2312]WFU70859.1 hypothetical protein QA642_37215 [Bradyrhizobium sp. CB2312]
MSSIRSFHLVAFSLSIALSAPAFAQQAGQAEPPPGSPAATITIPGNQLPPPLQKFGGKDLGVVDRIKFIQECVGQ